jgi:hypothetical protein
MATEIETEYTSKPFDRPVDRLFDNIITLEKLRDDYKNNELKTTSVELVLSDYKDENIADQVNININDILGNKYVTEIFLTMDNNDNDNDNIYYALVPYKNTPHNFNKLKCLKNILPKNIILPLSKMKYTPLFLIILNVNQTNKVTLHFKYYDERIQDIISDLPYSLYIEETHEEFRIYEGMWGFFANKNQINSVKLINNAFDKFRSELMLQDIDLLTSTEAFSVFSKSKKDIYLYRETHSPEQRVICRNGPEFAFALKHSHINPVKCSVICVNNGESNVIHEFVALPNSPQWLLNGTPLLLIKTPCNNFFCKYVDMVTNNEVFISTEIYKGYLSTDIRRQIATTNQLCSLGNNKYLFYSQIDVNVIYMNTSIQTDASGYFMVREKI